MSKIKRVVLYKHGVGHFEREATVTDHGEIRLAFRTEEMNDVLKSLTVYDQGGGIVSSVSYDNKKPVSKLLEDISLDLPEGGGGVEMLGSLRGAEVAVTIGGRTITGLIVGIDLRVSSKDDSVCQRHLLTIFDAQGRLQSFDLEEVSHVALLDQSLQDDIRFLFTTVFSAKKQDAKTLKIFSRGEGERQLDISYVVECPVWKTSYRIALSATESEEKAYLQGWALVDNPQDEDWTDVSLSLVSGLPISFRHDLYSPRYLIRQEVAVERESSAGVVMAEGDLFGGGEEFDFQESAMFCDSEPPAPSAAPMAMMQRAMPAPALAGRGGGGSVKVETVTQKVGQLFEYKIDRPVTVLRNQSALVPIVNGEFKGGKKLLYNESKRAENPFSVVDFKNTTGLTLEGGPVTVFEGDIYAGEAMMDTVTPGEDRMLPYAVALEVEAKTEQEHDTKVIQQTVSHGVWRQQRASYKTTTYRLQNRGDKSRTVVVEHPTSEAELVNTPTPVSETRNYYRFQLELEAEATQSLKVTEKTVHHDSVSFTNSHLGHIFSLISGAGSGPEHSQFVAQLKALLEQERLLTLKAQELTQQLQEKEREQARIRENLRSLGETQEERSLRSRYVHQLDADETEFNLIRSQLAELREQLKESAEAFHKKAQEVSLERVFE